MVGQTGGGNDTGNVKSVFSKPTKSEKKLQQFNNRQKSVFNLEKQKLNIAPVGEDGQEGIEIDVKLIKPSPYQHRVKFDEIYLKELADSIKELKLIQPIVVRKKDNYYELIAGECRLRAVKDILGLATIEAIVKEVDDQTAAYMCFTENFSRKNLCEYEIYNWISIMKDNFGINQTEIAERLNLSRVRISQIMSVGKLPKDIMDRIIPLRLAENHIRALRKLQRTDTNLMYKLLSEIENSSMTSDEVAKRCKELLGSLEIIKTPLDTVSNEFIKKLSELTIRYNKISESEKKHIITRLKLAREAIISFENLIKQEAR